jgi:protein-disulfide isomerase
MPLQSASACKIAAESRRNVKRYLPVIIVAVVAILTIGSGAMLYRSKRAATPVSPNVAAMAEQESAESMHIRGPEHAPVTFEEFGDFQCPPCGTLAGPMHEAVEKFSPNVRVIFRHFPHAVHQHAREAACAAEAAGAQGRFWEMHDLLYREQKAWSEAADTRSLFATYAATLGLDVERFKKDMDDEKVKARVSLDVERGRSRGVSTTPTLFVNGRLLTRRPLNFAALHELVDAAMKEGTKHE